MQTKKFYEIIEHTADIGIIVESRDLKELFKNAGLALFDIMAEKSVTAKRPKKEKLEIKQKAQNLEELLVNWLNELLSLSATKELIFSDFQINKLGDNILGACVFGESVKNYKIKKEVKAATYHELKIEKAQKGWKAEVIFDV